MSKLAFIGLGNMGLPMACNLVKSGMEIRGFDLSSAARAAFAESGGIAANDLAHALLDVDGVITMLPNADIVRDLYGGADGIFAQMPQGSLLIDCSTIDVKTARFLADCARTNGQEFLDAPVSGGIAGAAAGSLAFMVGGSADGFATAQPILTPMAGKIVHCGGAGNGQAVKICNNMLLAVSMIGVSEAFGLGRALGLEDQTLFDVVSNASGQCWSLTHYCPAPGLVPSAPSNNGFKPGFSIDLMVKDLGLALDALKETGIGAPMGQQAAALYQALREAGQGGRDFSAIIEQVSLSD